MKAIAAEVSESSSKALAWRKQLLKLSEKASADQAAKAFCKWLTADPIAERVFKITLKVLPLKVIENVLEEQHYRLEDWRMGNQKINYRRFFDINELAALRIEDPKTFNWSHAKLKELARKYPIVHGFRVDHVDGLTDPESYLKRLKTIKPTIWIEKILGDGEEIPPQWPVSGTTGYEFSNMSARLFVDLSGLLHLHGHYIRHIDRRWERFHDCVYDAKREMLDSHFVSEISYLVDQFHGLASRGSKAPGFTRDELEEALKEVTSSLRVYRTYFVTGKGRTDLHWLKEAFKEVEGRGRLETTAALKWLRALMLERGDWSEPTFKAIKRWEQLTGPVMAKGLEDTALYRYFPLLSLNVVGGEPDWVGDGATEFHAFNVERLRKQPLTMSTTSTHDTKRSEDVRSRIHVVSELSEEWTQLFESWRKTNAGLRGGDALRPIPDVQTEYLIYETLLGAWPHDGKIDETFSARMKQYFTKAIREAKSETSWTEQNQSYEDALMAFVDRLLAPFMSGGARKAAGNAKFVETFKAFQARCSYFGAQNSLSLLTLKTLSPGLPDFYQGCELWDLSLVDPDNRRPVDYEARKAILQNMKRELRGNRGKYLSGLMRNWKSGEIKLWLTWQLLQLRKVAPDLFVKGEYLPLEPLGDLKRHFICFLRTIGDQWAFVIAPRLLANRADGLDVSKASLTVRDEELLDTEFHLPAAAPLTWRNALNGEKVTVDPETRIVKAKDLLQGLPIGVLTTTTRSLVSKRGKRVAGTDGLI